MGDAYRAVVAVGGKDRILKDQRGWLAARRRCLDEFDGTRASGCLKLMTRERTRALARLAGSDGAVADGRSEEHTSELQSLMRISYAVFCLQKNKNNHK